MVFIVLYGFYKFVIFVNVIIVGVIIFIVVVVVVNWSIYFFVSTVIICLWKPRWKYIILGYNLSRYFLKLFRYCKALATEAILLPSFREIETCFEKWSLTSLLSLELFEFGVINDSVIFELLISVLKVNTLVLLSWNKNLWTLPFYNVVCSLVRQQ